MLNYQRVTWFDSSNLGCSFMFTMMIRFFVEKFYRKAAGVVQFSSIEYPTLTLNLSQRLTDVSLSKRGYSLDLLGILPIDPPKSSEILDEGSDSGCSSPASPWRVVAPAEVPGQIARRDLPPIQPDAPWTPPGKERLFLNDIEYKHIDIRHIHQ